MQDQSVESIAHLNKDFSSILDNYIAIKPNSAALPGSRAAIQGRRKAQMMNENSEALLYNTQKENTNSNNPYSANLTDTETNMMSKKTFRSQSQSSN